MYNHDIIQGFANAFHNAFGVPIDPIPDDKIHRIDDRGRKGNKALWYILAPGGFGAFGNWRTDYKMAWTARDKSSLSPEEIHKARIEAEKRKLAFEKQQIEQHAKAANAANEIWKKAVPANPDHSYLVAKQVKPNQARQIGKTLFIPLHDRHFSLVNLQRIYFDPKETRHEKRFLTGGKIKECFSIIGDIEAGPVIGICEGWATGATLHQQHRFPIVCSMSANNLEPVAKIIKAKYRKRAICIFSDNDRYTPGNPGFKAGIKAAKAAKGRLFTPAFPCDQCGCSDYNDLMICKGGSHE